MMRTNLLHFDDALSFFEEELRRAAPLAANGGRNPIGNQTADVFLPTLAFRYWRGHSDAGMGPQATSDDLEGRHLEPFADVAWHLCQIGVLRPGISAHTAKNGATAPSYSFMITAHGYRWIETVADRPPTDPGRFMAVLSGLGRDYSEAFFQRAEEASRCYRAGNYLACCAMAGAAAEAVLLAVAAAKERDDEQVRQNYRKGGGRKLTTDRILHDVRDGSLKDRFASFAEVISYWRDEAAHGSATRISEAEASSVLTQLLRFAQLVHDRWSDLTAQRQPRSEKA